MKSSSWMDNYIQMFEGVFILFFHFCSISTFWSCHFSKFRNISCFSFIVIVILYIWKKLSQAKNIWWPDNRSSLYYICFISVPEKKLTFTLLLRLLRVYYRKLFSTFWWKQNLFQVHNVLNTSQHRKKIFSILQVRHPHHVHKGNFFVKSRLRSPYLYSIKKNLSFK